MDNLLKLAIEAHGGLERWRQFTVVKANTSITGALWHLKGQPDVLKDVQVVAQLHRQHLVTHLIGRDQRTIFSTGQVSIESETGVVEETRVDPADSFRGQSLDTPWDILHVAARQLLFPFMFVIQPQTTSTSDGRFSDPAQRMLCRTEPVS